MAASLMEKPGAETETRDERQVVVLHLDSEIYGVDIACVNTVLTLQTITPVPNVPDYVKGIMNLRGRILPVIDLRTRFHLAEADPKQRNSSRIVIVDMEGTPAGLIVDAVSEVLHLPAASIEPATELLNAAAPDCLSGIGRIAGGRRKTDGKEEGDKLILLLDIAEVLMLKSLAL